jgi:hypothetical protein
MAITAAAAKKTRRVVGWSVLAWGDGPGGFFEQRDLRGH